MFTVSGLRGIVGSSITPEIVSEHSNQFARFAKGKNFAIGRDTRSSGLIFAHSVTAGLLYAGCNVYDFGICPTPAIVMMVKKYNLDGGIQITASHNPENWNGLKFISREGRFFFASEIEKFHNVLRKPINKKIAFHQPPQLIKADIIEEYLHSIINSKYFKNIPNRKFRIGIDSCNGAAEESAIKLIKMLGSVPVSIKKAGFNFPRAAEPKSENLTDLSMTIKKANLDFGIAFDPDGDRFACVDELGVPLSEEFTILLALRFILKQKKGPVVVNNSTTIAVDDLCREFNVSLYRSKTGEANVFEKMQQVHALIGGEGNGGVIFPEINNSRDGLVATAMLIKLLAREKQPLSVIRNSFPKYFMLKTKVKDYHNNWQQNITNHFKNNPKIKLDKQDGLKLTGENFWILTRKSNTEPILRIIAESTNIELTKKLTQKVIKICVV